MEGHSEKLSSETNGAIFFLALPFLLLLFCVACFIILPSEEIPSPVAESGYFSPEQLEKLKNGAAYYKTHRLIGLAQFITTLSMLVLFLVVPGKKIEQWLFKPARPILSALFFFFILYISYFVISFPFSYARGVVVEREFGFLVMSGFQWFLLYLKSKTIGLVLGALLVAVFFFLIRHLKNFWWLPAAVILFLLSVFFSFISPLVFEPLFANFRRLHDKKLHDELIAISKKAGFDVKEILVSDESSRSLHTNAYFSGVGSTRRIVLYDTLLKNFSPQEVKVIVAHEAGHAKHHHIAKGLFLSALGITLFLCFLSFLISAYCTSGEFRFAYQPRVVALLAFWALSFSFLSSPINNLISRRMEVQADIESLRLTDDAESFISAEKKLALSNISELHPTSLVYWFYFTHPTVLERIALAERYRKSRGGE
ncbi:MAG: M48 family metallopeptidase [Planctomycetota bacterium]|nr:M48 family metallopeptidase [Planctomycetota bacterium]